MKEKEIEKKEETLIKEASKTDNNILSLDALIEKVSLLSQNNNPYTKSKEIEEIKSIFYSKLKLENKKNTGANPKEEDDKNKMHPLELKFKSVFKTYRKIKSDFRKSKEKEESKNLKIKKQIIEDINAIIKEEESIKITFERFRSLQKKWKETGHVPIRENQHIWQSYHHNVELFYDFIKLNNDLRDLDFKRNLEEKSEICKKAEELLEEENLNKMHNDLQELHEHWRSVGPVEKNKREPLWERFQNTSRKLNKKRNDYFLEKKTKEKKQLEAKEKICKEIDNLISDKNNSHKKWEAATKKCNELESKWKKLGKLSKDNNKIAWKRLRESLTAFYSDKNLFYKQKKKRKKEILEKKLIICEKAEKLQKNTNWEKTGKELVKLQEEWKNSDFIPHKESNEIWKRFRVACNTFFKNKKLFYKDIVKKQEEAYKKKEELLKEITKFNTKSKEDIKILKEFNLQWQAIGHVPKDKMKINDQFTELLNSKFSDLGLSKNVLETEKYKNKISSFQGNKTALKKEQQYITQKIDSLKKTQSYRK